jgi:hypothetical protein
MNNSRQLGILVAAAVCFYGIMLFGHISTHDEGGKTWFDLFAVTAFMLGPVFFIYLPLRLAISQHCYLFARPFVRIPLFLFALSPLFFMILIYIA